MIVIANVLPYATIGLLYLIGPLIMTGFVRMAGSIRGIKVQISHKVIMKTNILGGLSFGKYHKLCIAVCFAATLYINYYFHMGALRSIYDINVRPSSTSVLVYPLFGFWGVVFNAALYLSMALVGSYICARNVNEQS